MKYIDAHSHIDYITHKHQIDVVGTICCTTNEKQWELLSGMMQNDNRIFGAFGVHPWFVDSVVDGFDTRLENLLKTNRSYMVGEIGLDKYKPNMDRQIDVFKRQLDIAVKLKRNVFIHCVGAWDKILNVLKQYKRSELPILVMHAFNGSDEILKYLCDNYNVRFSFGKIDKDNEMHRIALLMSKYILIETDAKPDVVLSEVVNNIAEIKQDNNICDIIYKNTIEVINNE